MSKNHLVVVANFARDNGYTLTEAIDYLGDNFDELDQPLAEAYEKTYAELVQFAQAVMSPLTLDRRKS